MNTKSENRISTTTTTKTTTATTMTNRTIRNKRQFLEAVHLLAPGNKFIHSAARHVPQDMLPAVAGVAALEFASTLDLLCKSWRLRRPLELRGRPGRRSCRRRGSVCAGHEAGGSAAGSETRDTAGLETCPASEE